MEESKYNTKELLKKEYLAFLLKNGTPPVTVYSFCEKLNISESNFYSEFNSFKVLENYIWNNIFNETIEILNQDNEYINYSSQEKVLSFFYTIIEIFKQNRSFIVLRAENISRKNFRPKMLNSFRIEFNNWIKEIINIGIDNEEIAIRPIINEQYKEIFWVQFLYILRVWINDESKDFTITDAAIEKSSVLIFELMKKGPIDLAIDFFKFAYQNKAY